MARKRRRLLKRFREAREAAQAVAADGYELSTMPINEAATLVAAKMLELQEVDPEADPRFDWDALFAFLEKLLPLIIKLFGL